MTTAVRSPRRAFESSGRRRRRTARARHDPDDRTRRLTPGTDVRPGETVSERDGAPIRWAGERRWRPAPPAGGVTTRAPARCCGTPAVPAGGAAAPDSAGAHPTG